MARLVTGALPDGPGSFRTYAFAEDRLWRCPRCRLQTIRRGDRLLDPSEDGTSLVPHPCEVVFERKIAHAGVFGTSVALGAQQHRSKGIISAGGHRVLLCRALGCQQRVGRVGPWEQRASFCPQHWWSLAGNVRRGLLETGTFASSHATLFKAARAFLHRRAWTPCDPED